MERDSFCKSVKSKLNYFLPRTPKVKKKNLACTRHGFQTSVATAVFFTLDLRFFCFIWGSSVFIENLFFFCSGQILEMYVVLLYFPFKNKVNRR